MILQSRFWQQNRPCPIMNLMCIIKSKMEYKTISSSDEGEGDTDLGPDCAEMKNSTFSDSVLNQAFSFMKSKL